MITFSLKHIPLVNFKILRYFKVHNIKTRRNCNTILISSISEDRQLINKYDIIDTKTKLSPPQYINAVFHNTYSNLSNQHEWLHTNRNIAYIQLLISDYLYSYLEHVNHHANFNDLIEDIDNYRPNMDTNEVVNSLQV